MPMGLLRRRRERRSLSVAWNDLADQLLSVPDPERPGYGIMQPAARAGVSGVGGRGNPSRIAVSLPAGVPVPADVPETFKGFPVVIARYAAGTRLSYQTDSEEPVTLGRN